MPDTAVPDRVAAYELSPTRRSTRRQMEIVPGAGAHGLPFIACLQASDKSMKKEHFMFVFHGYLC